MEANTEQTELQTHRLSKWSQDCHHAAISSASLQFMVMKQPLRSSPHLATATLPPKHIVLAAVCWGIHTSTYTTIPPLYTRTLQNVILLTSAGEKVIACSAWQYTTRLLCSFASLYSLKLQSDVQSPASVIPLKLCVFNSISCFCGCGGGGGGI